MRWALAARGLAVQDGVVLAGVEVAPLAFPLVVIQLAAPHSPHGQEGAS